MRFRGRFSQELYQIPTILLQNQLLTIGYTAQNEPSRAGIMPAR